MKAVYVKEFGGPENLEIREVENPPAPTGKEVLVRIKAAALNRADLLQRRGFYPPPKNYPERILGLEFAGEVAETGGEVTDFKTDDRVFGITAGGAQAELLLSEESLLTKIPENLSFTEAAAIPEAFITAHDAIFTNGELKENERLLIHAVGSGVGLAALQLAKARGIDVIGTSRTLEKTCKAAEYGLGMGITFDGSAEDSVKDLAELIHKFNKGDGVDVILDLVGAEYFQANIESLNLRGRIILVGTTSGSKAELNFSQVMSKRLKIIGTVLRPRSTPEKAEATRKFAEEVVPLFASGKLKANIDKVFKLEEIRKAHEYLESNASFGKVVLEL